MVLIGTFILFFSGFAWVQYLNFSGFCYSQKRYLSDQELLNVAVQHNIDRDKFYFKDQIQYGSIAEFLQLNPNCCALFRRSHHMFAEDIWVRAFGWYVVIAEVFYKIQPSGPDNYYYSYITLDACGKVLEQSGPIESMPPRPRQT
jgi:hypothetical protein